MVSSATSYSGSGLRDWLLQRMSAIYMLIYVCVGALYLWIMDPSSYEEWHALFEWRWVRVSTFLFILNLMIHAWIGLWTVATDYLKSPFIRNSFYFITFTFLAGNFAWSVDVFWR